MRVENWDNIADLGNVLPVKPTATNIREQTMREALKESLQVVLVVLFWTLCTMLPTNVATAEVVIIPAANAEANAEELEWAEYHAEAKAEYEDEFTALFNSYTYKVSKNGRSMINGKFVAMPKGNA